MATSLSMDTGIEPAVAQPAGWCVRFLTGAVAGRTITLKAGINVLGSSGESDVLLPGSDVLPRHLIFTVGELVVSMQRVGTATARLNGDEMQASRRSVVAGDVVAIGPLEFQLDRVYASTTRDDPIFAPEGSGFAEQAAAKGSPTKRGPPRHLWLAGGMFCMALVGVLVLWSNTREDAGALRGGQVNLAEVERAIVPFPEVEVLAVPGGTFSVKGYVESRSRRDTLQKVMSPFGKKVAVNVHSAEEMVEQARRYVADPGIAVSYAGKGRLIFTGTVEDTTIRQKIARLGEDLHPSVLVSDRVQYREKPAGIDRDKEARAQWEGWQTMLPARMVSITEDNKGLRHIQLANGSRYYEGAVTKSGAEIKQINADGLVFGDGSSNEKHTR